MNNNITPNLGRYIVDYTMDCHKTSSFAARIIAICFVSNEINPHKDKFGAVWASTHACTRMYSIFDEVEIYGSYEQ